MKAVLFNKFGPSSVLSIQEVATPKAGPGEVLIKIGHTSVNPVDYKIREGYLQSMLPHEFPIITGWDAAGSIAAVGEGVTAFKVGDAVYAYTRLPKVHAGTYAEYIALPESFVAIRTDKLSEAEAAGVPLVGLTAYQALHEIGKVQHGDHVLITGGAGGVGSLAVQFAKIAGAEVTATASAGNHDYLRSLGADHVVDYQSGEYEVNLKKLAPQGFDMIFDAVGGETLASAEKLVKNSARLVSIVDTPKAGNFHFVYPNGEQLKAITKLFDSGKVKTPAIQVRSVTEAAAAQDESAKHRGRGKVVLRIDFN